MSRLNNPEFLISNLSLPKPLMAVGSVSAHERYLETVGAYGIELTPVNVSRFMGRLLVRATMLEDTLQYSVSPEGREYLFDQVGYDSNEDEAFGRLIRSQHSSFRGDVHDSGIVARTVPTWRESLQQMRKIQLITGKLAAVLYPGFEDGKVIYDDDNAPFAERTFQPNAPDWRRMGLDEAATIDDIKTGMEARGFTGVTYDLLHCQSFEDPLGLAERLAASGLVGSVHLSVNRLDITGLRSPLAKSTRGAKAAFVRSAKAASRTLEGEILTAIADQWQQSGSSGKIVVEDGPLRLGNVRKEHTAIIAHARELVGSSVA